MTSQPDYEKNCIIDQYLKSKCNQTMEFGQLV